MNRNETIKKTSQFSISRGISAIIEHEFYRFYYFYIVKRKCFHRLQKAAGSMISVI